MKDEKGNICPLLWKSKIAKRVTRSTLDAETVALGEGLDNGIWLRRLWEEIEGTKLVVKGFTDSRNLVEAAKSVKNVGNKRTRIELAYIKELLEEEEVEDVKVADGLTKKNGAMERLNRGVGAVMEPTDSQKKKGREKKGLD